MLGGEPCMRLLYLSTFYLPIPICLSICLTIYLFTDVYVSTGKSSCRDFECRKVSFHRWLTQGVSFWVTSASDLSAQRSPARLRTQSCELWLG